jgi:hypothetical protein
MTNIQIEAEIEHLISLIVQLRKDMDSILDNARQAG